MNKILLINKIKLALKYQKKFQYDNKFYIFDDNDKSNSYFIYVINKTLKTLSFFFTLYIEYILFIIAFFISFSFYNILLEYFNLDSWIWAIISFAITISIIYTFFSLFIITPILYIIRFLINILSPIKEITEDNYYNIVKKELNKEEKKSFWQKYKEYKAKYDENNK